MDRNTHDALRRDGDGYHERNHEGIGTIADPIFDQLCLIHESEPITSLLEIGCTNGFRLEKAREAFAARCCGLEVSSAAISEGRTKFPEVEIVEGVAPSDLNYWNDLTFDTVIVGHFEYLLPRSELFALASEIDRLLRDGGHLVVMDFLYPHAVSAPYTHDDQLRVFKHDPSRPWTWSPTYSLIGRQVYELSKDPQHRKDPRAWQTVDVVRKLATAEAYPEINSLQSVHDDGSHA